MKKISILLIIILILSSVTGCSDEKKDISINESKEEKNPLESKIIGEWKYHKEVKGFTDEKDFIFEFKDDGTYITTGIEKVTNAYGNGEWYLVEDILYTKTKENSDFIGGQLKNQIEIQEKNGQKVLTFKYADGKNKGKPCVFSFGSEKTYMHFIKQ